MADSSEEVLVRVKSASHPSCEDVEFGCNPKSTTVRQVKEKIRTLYSFHPDIADQRLIYSGHLLDDVQLLTDVFGLSGATGTATYTNQGTYQHSGPYTIHLACTSKSYVSPNQRNVRNDNLSSDSSQTHAYPSQIPNPMMQDPRLVGNMQGQVNPFEINGNSGVPPEFYALHQLYVEQMSAYMRSWNLAYGIVGVGGSAIPVQFPGTLPNLQNMPMPNVNVNIPGNNNIPQQPQPIPQNVPPQQAPLNERVAPAAAARAGGLAGNLGGGFGGLFGAPAAPGNDDEENQRDFLDWAYTISRLVLILSVVYFYSNFTRFLLVVIFTIAIALFQRRPFQQQNPEAQNRGVDRPGGNNNNNPANPAPGAAAAVNEAGGANREGNAGAEPENNNREGPNNANGGDGAAAQAATGPDAASHAAEANVAAGAAAAGQHRFAYYRDVTWTFLTTFFTSLIPEMPQHN